LVGQFDCKTRTGEFNSLAIVSADVVRAAHEDEGHGLNAGGGREQERAAASPAVELNAL
jgi:hypothetical protein